MHSLKDTVCMQWFKRPRWSHWIQLCIIWALIVFIGRWFFAERDDFLPVSRECVVHVETQKVFANKSGARFPVISGYGVVIQADRHLDWLIGKKVFFKLKGEKPSRVIMVEGILERADATNSRLYPFLRSSGIHYQIMRGRFETVPEVGKNLTIFEKQKESIRNSLSIGAEDSWSDQANLLVGMLLGEKEVLSDEQKAAFVCSGTMHLFAVSGVHVGMIAATLYWILSLLRLPRRIIIGLQLLALWNYVWIVGHSPSALRACLMVTFYWMAELLGRKTSTLNTLLLSAAAILIVDPDQFWNIGFQLSYAIVIGIVCVGVPFGQWANRKWVLFRYFPENAHTVWHRWFIKFKEAIVGLVCTSIIATIISGPMVIEYFRFFTWGGIFANVLFLPLAGVVVALGVCSILFGAISCVWLVQWINVLAYIGILTMETVGGWVQKLSFTYWKWECKCHWLLDGLTIAFLIACFAFKSRLNRLEKRGAIFPIADRFH